MLVPWQLKQLEFQIWRTVVRAVGNRRDLLPVDPSLGGDVPEHRQHVDAPFGQRRQIALIPLRAERVVDGEGFRRAAAERHRHVRLAVLRAERVRAIVIGELRPFAEVTNDGGFGDRLGHLDVQRVLPLRVLDVVTLRAGAGAQILAALPARRKVLGPGTWGLGLLVGADGQRQQQDAEASYQSAHHGTSMDYPARVRPELGGLDAEPSRTKIKGP